MKSDFLLKTILVTIFVVVICLTHKTPTMNKLQHNNHKFNLYIK